MFIHYLMCLVQILYTIYNLTKWHIMMIGLWVRANWRKRARFIETYRPSTDHERELYMSYKNAAGSFQYDLKKRMLTPRPPADEDDPIWGELNKKSNVDNRNRR